MKKFFFTLLVVCGLVFPQIGFASEVRDASSCVHWDLGVVSFWTGSVKVDVFDDVTGALISSHTEKCGSTKFLFGLF